MNPKTNAQALEALTATSVAPLTIDDMCQAVDRGMTLDGVRLVEMHGGKSGHFVAPGQNPTQVGCA